MSPRKSSARSGMAALACLSLIVAAPAWAQSQAGHPAGNPPWAITASEKLHLTPVQKAAFQAYVDVNFAKITSVPQLSAEGFRAMTDPERLDFLAKNIAIDLRVMQARAKVTHKLYDLLSVEQKKLFDQMTALPREGAMPAATVQQSRLDKPNYELPSHTRPSWLFPPPPETLARVYPAAAVNQNLGGKVQLHCVVDVEGYLANCVVSDETPAGLGFGNAALEITAYMRMHPATTFGVPVPSEVIVPVSFAPQSH